MPPVTVTLSSGVPSVSGDSPATPVLMLHAIGSATSEIMTAARPADIPIRAGVLSTIIARLMFPFTFESFGSR
jgi:hypothetical protein